MALHRALQTAVKWGVIGNNPADAIDPPRFQRSEIRIISEDDIRTFLEAAAARFGEALASRHKSGIEEKVG